MSTTAGDLTGLSLLDLPQGSTEDTPKNLSIRVDQTDPVIQEILNRIILSCRLQIAKNNNEHPSSSEDANYPFYAKIFMLHELQKYGIADVNRLSAKTRDCDLKIFASCFEEVTQLCVLINSRRFTEIPIKGRAVKLVRSFNISKLHFESGTYCLLESETETILPDVEYSISLVTRNNHKFVSVGVAGTCIAF